MLIKNFIALASNLCPKQGWRMWLQRSSTGMSCVNVNSYIFDHLPHTARGIPLSEGTVGSILPFVGQLSLVAWMRIKNGRGDGRALSIRIVPQNPLHTFPSCIEPVKTVGAATEHFLQTPIPLPQLKKTFHRILTHCLKWDSCTLTAKKASKQNFKVNCI